MRILVTGAAGFIGSHLCEALARRGHAVIGLDNFAPYYRPELKAMNAAEVEAAGVPVRRLDLSCDPLEAAVEGIEVVYHAAAQPGIHDRTPFDDYLRNNVIATKRLLDACRASRSLRFFVNVATSSVYGRHATDAEEAAARPTSDYGVTKLAAEQLVLAAQREKGFPATSLRLFSVYGPRERPEKLYPLLIGAILRDEAFPLYEGSREHSRSFTFVDDIVAGFLAVLDHVPACVGEIFNIGSDIEITTGRGIEIVESILGRKARIEVRPRRSGDQLRTSADIGKARRLLGYAPQIRPEEGLAAEVAWYRDRIHGRADR